MAKFEVVYPYMRPIEDEIHGIIRAREARPCGVCGESTEYVEINYEAHICSEECLKILDKNFFEALRRTE